MTEKDGNAPIAVTVTDSLRRRFEAKYRVDASGCWLWTAALNNTGYGQIALGGSARRMKLAHRVSWEIHRGPPGTAHVLHTCDTPACVNPDHLFLGTHADNMRDMTRKGRHGLVLRPERASRGDTHTHAKLTRKRVSEARALHAAGASYTALANRFGMSVAALRRAVLGLTWAHVAPTNTQTESDDQSSDSTAQSQKK